MPDLSKYGVRPRSASEIETQYYVDQEKEKQGRRKRLLQPIMAILDVLNRGQYVSANIAQEVVDKIKTGDPINLWEAIKGGITGKVKGDYKDVLFGEGGIAPWEPETGGGKALKGVTTFLANVLLDPTTYIGFGPTSAAKKAAKNYADDVVKFTFRELGAEGAAPKLLEGFSIEKLRSLMAKNVDEGVEYLSRMGGDDIARRLNEVYKTSYKRGLRTPSGELTTELSQRFGDDIVTNLDPNRYLGTGQRSLQFMQKEFLPGERYPLPVKMVDATTDYLRNSKVGSVFSDAVWSLTKPGTLIGNIKTAFGIRNPYQQMLRNMEMESRSSTPAIAWKEADQLRAILKPIDDKTKKIIRDVLISSQDKPLDLLPLKTILDEETAQKATTAIQQIRQLTDKWKAELDEAVREGIIKDYGFIENYLPLQHRRGRFFKRVGTVRGQKAPGFTFTRTNTFEDALDREARKLVWTLGIEYDEAMKLVKEGAGNVEVDLERALMTRALAQAKAVQRFNIIRQFREFGVNANQIDELKKMGFGTSDAMIENLGLVSIPDDSLKGYLFDKDVAEILNRAVKITQSDDSLDVVKNGLQKYTSWIKGWLTLSTGFHARNMYSNNFTGFMKHGTGWWNPKYTFHSTLATVVGLKGEDGAKAFFKKVGISEARFNQAMATKYGDKTLRELAEEATMRGVISRETMGFDYASTIENLVQGKSKAPLGKRLNPLSKDFGAFEASHAVGNYVESIPRFQSFLIDYDKVSKTSPAGALEWATTEAKKWFIDYGDLCFDTETEILTDSGWQTIDSIGYDQRALTFNLKDDVLEWKEITYIHKAGYNGPMHYLNNCGLNAAVTPKHKWVKIGGKQGGHWTIKKDKYQLIETRELLKKDTRIKVTCDNFAIHGDEFFGDDFVRLVGWVLAEGSYLQKGESIQVFQSKNHNPKYCSELRRLAGVFKESTNIYEEKGKDQKDIMVLYVGGNLAPKIRDWCPGKLLTMKFLNKLTRKQMEILYEVLMSGDGHRKRYGNGGTHDTFTQKDQEFVKNFQALCMMIGRRSVVRPKDECFTVDVYKKEAGAYVSAINERVEKYSGRIWCIHTDNRTLVARRGGTVYISGNTEFERRTLKSVIPFYTWIRKNLANQMSAMVELTDMYSLIPKAQGALEDEDATANLPNYMKEMGYFAMDEKVNDFMGILPISFWPNMPYQDLNKIPVQFEMNDLGIPIPRFESPWQTVKDILGDAHPALKSVVEIAGDVDLFYETPLGKNRKVPGVGGPVLAFLDATKKRITGEGFDLEKDNKGDIVIDARVAKLLEENLPLLRQIEKFLQAPALIEPLIDNTQDSLKNKGDDVNEFFKALSFYAGVKFTPIDEEKWRNEQAEEILRAAEDAKYENRKNRPGYQSRSDDYWKERRASYRRYGL
jgi:hypothetical protein